MNIGDLLLEKSSRDVKVVSPNDTLREAARRLVDHNIGALLVVDASGALTGIVSERDLIRAFTQYDGALIDKVVADVMTQSVITCDPQLSVGDALLLMKGNGVRHLPVRDGGDIIGVISIRELTRAYEMLELRANTDALTGLSNRRHFLERLEYELARSNRYGQPLSLAMIDIDHFKKTNDTYGHEAGDRVLEALGRILVRELRNIDSAGRLGGEEFAAIFPETNIHGARIACNRLLAAIRKAVVEASGVSISFSVSIGLAAATSAAQDSATILRRADKLLYAAKRKGRNRMESDADPADQPEGVQQRADAEPAVA